MANLLSLDRQYIFQGVAGGQVVDDRGCLAYTPLPADFTPKRFYRVSNHVAHFVRAWHGHQVESKLLVCIAGAVLVAIVEPDDWATPSPSLPCAKVVLSANKPDGLLIPAGKAHGWMSLTPDATLLVLSDKTAQESQLDDYRFPARLWDAWQVEER